MILKNHFETAPFCISKLGHECQLGDQAEIADRHSSDSDLHTIEAMQLQRRH